MVETVYKPSRVRNNKWYEVESSEDVLANILSRLPVESLVSYKCVSKQWNRLISSPSFIHMQLMRSKEKPVYVFYPQINDCMGSYLVDGDRGVIGEIAIPSDNIDAIWAIIGCVDGLIVYVNHPEIGESKYNHCPRTAESDNIANYPLNTESGEIDNHPWLHEPNNNVNVVVPDLQICVCNPATGEVFSLPKGSPSKEQPSFGFGVGPRINDYKVFRFFSPADESQANHCECEVYPSSTGSWKGIGCVPHTPMFTCHNPIDTVHTFAGGQVYWFIASEEDPCIAGSIVVVDMEDEFRILDLPMEVTEISFPAQFEDCISLVVVDGEAVNIWVFNDGDKPNWELKYCDYFPFSDIDLVDHIASHKSEVFFVTSEHSYIYRPVAGSWKKLCLDNPLSRVNPVVFTYTESLLSCSGHLNREREDNVTCRRRI